MISRNFQMFQIEVFAPSSIFEDTLFDAELCLDFNGFLKLLVFDVVYLEGKCCKNEDFLYRYKLINRLFPAPSEWNLMTMNAYSMAQKLAKQGKIMIIPNTESKIIVYSKQCVTLDFLGTLTRTNLNHASDGYIFMPIADPIQKGTHEKMFKYKFDSTIDLQYNNEKFYCMKHAKYLLLTDTFPDLHFTFDLKNNSFTDELFIIEMNVKFIAEKHFELIYYRTRYDKDNANQIATIQEIFREVNDKITMQELTEVCESIS